MDSLIGKIGYTGDGLIFHITDATMPSGETAQATFTYTPSQALAIARKFEEAVDAGTKAAKRSKEISDNGGSDSTGDSRGSAPGDRGA